jgi:cholesterol oxidase
MKVDYDAVVIGSGFGGSINALRLAQAGRSVLVLERGRRYQSGEFPRDSTDIDKLFWRYPRKPESRGLYELRFFSGIATVVASGVGGGSLIYANIHIRPDASVFDDRRWPRSINRAQLDPYYGRVGKMLGVSPVPLTLKLAKRDAFREAAGKMGREVFDPDEAVDWSKCPGVAQCEFGCQHGAKNTTDLSYLSEAESLGAYVRTGANVTHIEPVEDAYRVRFAHVDDGSSATATASRVVLSAGTLGTNEILLRSRDVTRTLPKLSDRLGHGYSGNGDFLGSIQNASRELTAWEGPDVTSVIRFNDANRFTMAAPGFSHPVMAVLASLGQLDGRWLRWLGPLAWPFMESILPWIFEKGFLSKPARLKGPHAGAPSRMTNLFAIGRDNANGVIRLNHGKLDIEWDYARENRGLIDSMLVAMNEVNRCYGGTFAPLVTWGMFEKILTVHSLGGCNLSDSPKDGVVSPHGEVHGYPGLFVADGSVIPTAIGFHPAMTISAVAEWIAEAVVRSYKSGG